MLYHKSVASITTHLQYHYQSINVMQCPLISAYDKLTYNTFNLCVKRKRRRREKEGARKREQEREREKKKTMI